MRINCSCCVDNMIHDFVFNVKRKSYFALQDLRKTGLEDKKAVHIFKTKINELIDWLKKSDTPNLKNQQIKKEIVNQNRLKNAIDLLIKYKTEPTEIIAEQLRRSALLDVNSTEFIKEQMDKQKDPKFRFDRPNDLSMK